MSHIQYLGITAEDHVDLVYFRFLATGVVDESGGHGADDIP